MEFILTILLIFIIIYLFTIKSFLEEKFKTLTLKVDFLKNELDTLKKRDIKIQPESKIANEPNVVPEISKPAKEPVIDIQTKVEELRIPIVQDHVIPAEKPSLAIKPVPVPPKPKPVVKQPSFFERHPDLEKFIGENLINKIGIGILVIGIAFFVKYAIDQEWINEIGRVFIGIFAGGLLIGIAHRLRKSFVAFSSVLVGGGIAVLYFTIAIAFHEYQIFSQTAAFALMVVITCFAVLLSIGYNRVELAVIAMLGGFVTPFLLSTGEGNYVVLFSYLLILNAGMLVLAYFKKWNLINIIAYVLTVIIYSGWLGTKLNSSSEKPYAGAMVFATLFYFVFFLMNVINNLKEKRKFQWPEFSILLSNTFFYYGAGMFILKNISEGVYQGLFTVILGLFNFIFAFALFRSSKADKNLVYLLIGLVLTFVSLAAPVQLKGNYITMFWAMEAVLLFWLAGKSGIKLMEVAGIAVIVLMMISLIMDWPQLYLHQTSMLVIFNKAGITTIMVIASLSGLAYLTKNKTELFAYLFPPKYLHIGFLLLLFLTCYTGGLLELIFQMNTRIGIESLKNVVTGIYNLSYLVILYIGARKINVPVLQWAAATGAMMGIFTYLVYYQPESVYLREDFSVNHTASFAQFFIHYFNSILTIALAFTTYHLLKNIRELKSEITQRYLWLLSFVLIYVFSAELDHAVVLLLSNSTNLNYVLSQNHKIGYPILWGIASFIFMIVGMKVKSKDLRIISLVLFLIILLKLFIFDLRGISEGGKIAAFISLGILLLVVSFMYQKLKNLVLEETVKSKEGNL